MSYKVISIETPIKVIEIGSSYGIYNVSWINFLSTPTPHASIWANISWVDRQIGVVYSPEMVVKYRYD